jgi:hypothetical protein
LPFWVAVYPILGTVCIVVDLPGNSQPFNQCGPRGKVKQQGMIQRRKARTWPQIEVQEYVKLLFAFIPDLNRTQRLSRVWYARTT